MAMCWAAAPAMAQIALVGQPGYQLTVKVPSYPLGTTTVHISIATANGYTDQTNVAASGSTSWTFNIPANQGNWVRMCVNSPNSSAITCNTYNTTGTNMSVSLSPLSGNSNGYYIHHGHRFYGRMHNGFGRFHG